MEQGIIYGMVCTCPKCDPEEIRYVGQTINFQGRKSSHKSPSGDYVTPRYKFVHAHGANNIDFKVLEEVAKELLDEREMFWIKELETFVLDSDRGLNATPGGDRAEWDERYYEELRETRKDLNWNARKLDWETVKKIRDDYRGTRTPIKELSKMYGVAEGTLYKVVRNESWKDNDYEYVPRPKEGRNYNYGEKAYASKFDWDEVREVRQKYWQGVPPTELADQYRVTQSTIYQIGSGRTWHDPEYTPPSEEELRGLRRIWTLENRYPRKLAETIRNEYASGESHRTLRSRHPVPASVLSDILHNKIHIDLDYRPRRAKNQPLTREEYARLDEMLKDGSKTPREIAKEFGVTKQTALARKRGIRS